MSHPTRWKKLTNEQLRGADYALRVMHTATVVRGEALAILEAMMAEVREESTTRKPTEAETK